MKRTFVIAALASIMVLVFAGAAAWAVPPQGGFGGWFSAAEYLGLNDAQADKMQQMHADFFKSQAAKRDQVRDIMFQLRQESFEPKPDMDKVRKLQDQAFKLRSEMREAALKHRSEMRSVLTPEQQAKWDSLRGPGTGMRFQGKGGLPGGPAPAR